VNDKKQFVRGIVDLVVVGCVLAPVLEIAKPVSFARTFS
jgi:hypothetical protein